MPNVYWRFIDSSITVLTKELYCFFRTYYTMILDKIYCPEEQTERVNKALRLNGFSGPVTRTTKTKPKVRIKRLVSDPQLRGASTLQSQRQGHTYGSSHNQSVEEHLASCELCRRVLQMERANKGLRLLTGL